MSRINKMMVGDIENDVNPQYGSGKSGNHTFHSPVAYSCDQVNVNTIVITITITIAISIQTRFDANTSRRHPVRSLAVAPTARQVAPSASQSSRTPDLTLRLSKEWTDWCSS